MDSMEDIHNRLIKYGAAYGIGTGRLFEYENSRWVCLGSPSYGGGQLTEYVREGGDYQVSLNSAATSFSEDEDLNRKADEYWGSLFGYRRVIVTHLEATGMIVEKVDDNLGYQHPGDPISLKTLREWQKKQQIDMEKIPDYVIPFRFFERVNDYHLMHEAGYDLDLKKLINAAKNGIWQEKDDGVIKLTLK